MQYIIIVFLTLVKWLALFLSCFMIQSLLENVLNTFISTEYRWKYSYCTSTDFSTVIYKTSLLVFTVYTKENWLSPLVWLDPWQGTPTAYRRFKLRLQPCTFDSSTVKCGHLHTSFAESYSVMFCHTTHWDGCHLNCIKAVFLLSVLSLLQHIHLCDESLINQYHMKNLCWQYQILHTIYLSI